MTSTTLAHTRTAPHAVESPDAIAHAYAACRQITRERARNFYYGLKLTPEPKRSAIYSIYAWMRFGDDMADGEGDDAARLARMDHFRAQTLRLLDGEESDLHAPIFRAFAHTVRRHDLPREDIEAMLDGLCADCEHRGYDTDEQLDDYCARVASSVGRICIAIWGLRPTAPRPEGIRLANLRGLAFQHTNILRDFAEDFDAGRIYLPLQAFRRAGITPAQLRDWSPADRCEAFVKSRAAAARERYNESSPLESMIDPECAPTLWAMTRIYSGILEKIERAPQRVSGGPRIRLQSLHKAGIAFRAVMMSRRDEW